MDSPTDWLADWPIDWLADCPACCSSPTHLSGMASRGFGRVILMGSIAGNNGGSGTTTPHYGPAKAALHCLARCVRYQACVPTKHHTASLAQPRFAPRSPAPWDQLWWIRLRIHGHCPFQPESTVHDCGILFSLRALFMIVGYFSA
jgi:hypothetical protein